MNSYITLYGAQKNVPTDIARELNSDKNGIVVPTNDQQALIEAMKILPNNEKL